MKPKFWATKKIVNKSGKSQGNRLLYPNPKEEELYSEENHNVSKKKKKKGKKEIMSRNFAKGIETARKSYDFVMQNATKKFLEKTKKSPDPFCW